MGEYITVSSQTPLGWIGWNKKNRRPTKHDVMDPCDFTAEFEAPIIFEDDYEVAVTEVSHGPLFNITARYNKFSIVKRGKVYDFLVTPGYYATTMNLLNAVSNVLASASRRLITNSPKITYKEGSDGCCLKILDPDVKFLIDEERNGDNNVLKHLGYSANGTTSRLDVVNRPLLSNTKMGIIFTDIVGDSVLDRNSSNYSRRDILGCIPLETSTDSYNHFKFLKPNYCPLRVHAFTNISFLIADIHGNKIEIQDEYNGSNNVFVLYPTVMRLHVRKCINSSRI